MQGDNTRVLGGPLDIVLSKRLAAMFRTLERTSKGTQHSEVEISAGAVNIAQCQKEVKLDFPVTQVFFPVLEHI